MDVSTVSGSGRGLVCDWHGAQSPEGARETRLKRQHEQVDINAHENVSNILAIQAKT